jgi:cobalamin biosynthesis protein CobD/CbiB
MVVLCVPNPAFGGTANPVEVWSSWARSLKNPTYRDPVPSVLIGVGALVIVLTFLLALTIFGEISAVLGVVCILVGAVTLGRRAGRPGSVRSGKR